MSSHHSFDESIESERHSIEHKGSTHRHSVASSADVECLDTDGNAHDHDDREINIKDESKWTLIILNLAFLTEDQSKEIDMTNKTN